MAKPRTNAAAVTYWAESILEREPRDAIEVNSIIVRNDVVYSFGEHYPMGVIQRAKDGRAMRVIVTSDRHPSRGFANTPGDQWNVEHDARDFAIKAGIPMVKLPLSDYALPLSGVQVRPSDDDPEPPAWSRCEVPAYFYAVDPGPEPTKDPRGCIAGTVEEYEVQVDDYVTGYGRDPEPWDFTFWTRYANADGTERKSLYVRRTEMHWTEWGAASNAWNHYSSGTPRATTYKQCPHCAVFDKVHESWYVRMHGLRWGRGRGKGFKLHSALMDRYGSEEGWRQARREDLARVKQERADRAAWLKRNVIPLSALSTEPDSYGVRRHRVPKMASDGYPLQKDIDGHFKRQRAAERAERRRQREDEVRARHQRQVERFARGIRSRRKPNIIQVATETAETIHTLREQVLAANANARRQSEEGDAQ